MGSFSLMHWIVVLAIILILFGAGKLPRVMGDFAKGIKAFKAGMKDEEDEETETKPKAGEAEAKTKSKDDIEEAESAGEAEAKTAAPKKGRGKKKS